MVHWRTYSELASGYVMLQLHSAQVLMTDKYYQLRGNLAVRLRMAKQIARGMASICDEIGVEFIADCCSSLRFIQPIPRLFTVI